MSIYAKRKKCRIVGNGTGRKGCAAGWPASRPAQARLQAGRVWWVTGPQAGLGRALGRARLVGGRPPGRAPGRRPSLFMHDDPLAGPQADFQTVIPCTQRLDFGEGYLYPSIYLKRTSTTKRRTPPLFQSFKSIDLPL